MAITLVQSKRRIIVHGGNVTTDSITIDAPATAGNVIICILGVDKGSGDILLPYSDLGSSGARDFSSTANLEYNSGANVTGQISYKVAAGGEDTFTVDWTTPRQGNTIYILEYSGLDTSSPLDQAVQDITNTNTNARTTGAMTTGTLSQAAELCIAVFMSDSSTSIFGGAFSWTNSFAEIFNTTDQNVGSPGLSIATKTVAATTAVSTTGSYTGGVTDQCIGFLATFKEATGGGSAIAGTAAITEESDTVAAASAVALQAALAVTEGGDTLAAASTAPLKAAAGITEGNDTLAAASAVSLQAALGVLEAGDTISATGIVANTGLAVLTEADDSVSAAAKALLHSALAITEADDALASTAALAIVAALAVTEADDTLSATDTVPAVPPVTRERTNAVSIRAFSRPDVRGFSRPERRSFSRPSVRTQ